MVQNCFPIHTISNLNLVFSLSYVASPTLHLISPNGLYVVFSRVEHLLISFKTINLNEVLTS